MLRSEVRIGDDLNIDGYRCMGKPSIWRAVVREQQADGTFIVMANDGFAYAISKAVLQAEKDEPKNF